MKILMAVVNCHTREQHAEAVRSTWLQRVVGADVKIFRGQGATREPMEHEVFLDCDDTYEGLPKKVKAIITWALERGYDYVLKIDDDVVVSPSKMLNSGFTDHDFVGCKDYAGVKPGEIDTPWGFCYWLSKRAMEVVAAAPIPGEPGSTHSYYHNNDEAWVSTVLYINKIYLHSDRRYFLWRGKRPESNVPRGLRAPKRPEPIQEMPPEGCFAVCLYIDCGYHDLPAETIVAEYLRLDHIYG